MIRLKPDQSLAAAEAALNVMRPNIREATMPPRVGARFAAQYLGEREPFTLTRRRDGRFLKNSRGKAGKV